MRCVENSNFEGTFYLTSKIARDNNLAKARARRRAGRRNCIISRLIAIRSEVTYITQTLSERAKRKLERTSWELASRLAIKESARSFFQCPADDVEFLGDSPKVALKKAHSF